MTEEVINDLPEILKKYKSSIKKVSLDGSRKVPMCDSQLSVVNFDKIPNEYSKGRGWAVVPCSNDALYITDDREWYFIEFKNGTVDKANVYRKIYDSLIILIELGIIPSFQFVRDNMNYILVYNSDKYPKIQQSVSRDAGYAYILDLAKEEKKLFEIYKFEGYLFKSAHTYDKDEFNVKFVDLMEQQEENFKS